MAPSKTSPECPAAHRAAHTGPTGLGERRPTADLAVLPGVVAKVLLLLRSPKKAN